MPEKQYSSPRVQQGDNHEKALAGERRKQSQSDSPSTCRLSQEPTGHSAFLQGVRLFNYLTGLKAANCKRKGVFKCQPPKNTHIEAVDLFLRLNLSFYDLSHGLTLQYGRYVYLQHCSKFSESFSRSKYSVFRINGCRNTSGEARN